MTLIEAVAGIVILGTLLASLVIARGRYLRQWALAGRKQQAVASADSLLANWWANPAKLPLAGAGEIPEHRLRWITRVVQDPTASDLQVQIVRLEMFDEDQLADRNKPLASVDVVFGDPSQASTRDSRDEKN